MSRQKRGDGSEPFISRRPQPLRRLDFAVARDQLSTMAQQDVECWNVVEHWPAVDREEHESHDVITGDGYRWGRRQRDTLQNRFRGRSVGRHEMGVQAWGCVSAVAAKGRTNRCIGLSGTRQSPRPGSTSPATSATSPACRVPRALREPRTRRWSRRAPGRRRHRLCATCRFLVRAANHHCSA